MRRLPWLLRLGLACLLLAAQATQARAAEIASVEAIARAADVQLDKIDDVLLDADRSRLATNLAALERRLVPGSSNAHAWKQYLGWETLQQFTQGAANPKLEKLQACLDNLASGEPGLEIEEFQQVAQDARRLFDHLLLATLPDPAKFGQQQAKQLLAALRRDPQMLDPRASFAVEQRLDLFAGAPGGEQIVSAMSKHFGRPNLLLTTSSGFLNRAAARPINETRPVTDCILGTSIRGTGDTIGQLHVTLVPSFGSARMLLGMSGNVCSRTIGTNGPVCIRSLGDTSFAGTKLVQLTRQAFATSSATFNANTHTRTQGVSKRGGGFGERIVVAVAKKRIAKQKGQAEAIAAHRAEGQLAAEFDQQVRQQISLARRDFEQQVIVPFQRRHAEPRQMAFSTTSHDLQVEMLHATRGQLAAPDAPPNPPSRAVGLRIHQSAANNLAATILSGAVLSSASADAPAKLDVALPNWVEQLSKDARRKADVVPEEDFKPWSLTFRKTRPLSFAFEGNHLEIIIHAAKIASDDRTYNNWDFIVRYAIVHRDGQLLLERAGDIDALPTNFDPKSGRRLRGTQIGFRNNLKDLLNTSNAMPEEIKLRPIKMRNNRGELVAKELASAVGWLTAGWDVR